jgi:hypothetical protein
VGRLLGQQDQRRHARSGFWWRDELAVRIKAGLASHRLPVFLALLAALLTLPTLWQGWVADDLIHRQILLATDLPAALRGLFVFVDPGEGLQLMDLDVDLGTMPWWSLSGLHISFFRPLSALTHWLDYRLWPASSLWMHAQNVIWYAAICGLATRLYRRLMGFTWAAGLAALFFALDPLHLGAVAWLANRNVLLSLFFSLAALLFHDRWRRHAWPPGAWLAPISLALALLSAESAVATAGFLLAHALFLDQDTWRRRVRALLPYGLVLLVWGLVYQQLGYGAWGSGFYTDPLREPARYASAVLERGPILLLAQWLGLIPLPYNLLSAPAARVVWILALLFLASLALLLLPLIRRDPVASFLALGMLVAVVPTCAINLLSGRLLPFVGFGAMGLLAQFVQGVADGAAWRPARRAWRAGARLLFVGLLGLHAFLPPLLAPVTVRATTAIQTVIDRVTDLGPLPEVEGKDVVVVNAPSPFHFIYYPSTRVLQGRPMPAHLRTLASGYGAVEVSRLDDRTLSLRPAGGYLLPPGTLSGDGANPAPPLHTVYMYQHLSLFFRSDAYPLTLGYRVELTGAIFDVIALTDDGRPAEVRVRFTQPLEDPSYTWLQWSWKYGGYMPFLPPTVGETVRVSGPF